MTEDKRAVNYRTLFVSGLAFVGGGVAMGAAIGWPIGISLIAVGLAFEVIGLKKRDQWGD
jgi:hypothetical protein